MMNKLSKSFLTLAIAASPWFTAPSAFSGPLDEAKARAHLAAIAASDLEGLMRDYADDAYMEWVGGPLDGRYRGKDQIRLVWQKFITVNEGKPRPVKLGKPQAYANPRGASIEARAAYDGKLPMKVWHVLTYREGELTTEVWHIAPTLQID
jgi:ketosteroid isomerase-like protein